MIITESNIIPFKQYNAITLWPFIIFRKDRVAKLKATNKYNTVLRHEKIHYQQ